MVYRGEALMMSTLLAPLDNILLFSAVNAVGAAVASTVAFIIVVVCVGFCSLPCIIEKCGKMKAARRSTAIITTATTTTRTRTTTPRIPTTSFRHVVALENFDETSFSLPPPPHRPKPVEIQPPQPPPPDYDVACSAAYSTVPNQASVIKVCLSPNKILSPGVIGCSVFKFLFVAKY